MDENKIDVAIIGCGPAGLSAAINCLRRNKRAVIFGKSYKASALYKAEHVDNYLGLSLSGHDIMEKFFEHAQNNNVEFVEGRVQQIFDMGNGFTINCENKFYESLTVIIATGIASGSVIENEKEFIGRGVSYCATCDGMLYKGKKAVVIADSEDAVDDANFLSEICSEVVYIPRRKNADGLKSSIKIENVKPKAIAGDNVVQKLITDTGEIYCDGIFFIKDAMPPDNIIQGIKIENNSIVVDRFMSTNIKNVFAAGDCTGKPFQAAKAVGEGLVAALEASKAIDLYKFGNK